MVASSDFFKLEELPGPEVKFTFTVPFPTLSDTYRAQAEALLAAGGEGDRTMCLRNAASQAVKAWFAAVRTRVASLDCKLLALRGMATALLCAIHRANLDALERGDYDDVCFLEEFENLLNSTIDNYEANAYVDERANVEENQMVARSRERYRVFDLWYDVEE